MLAAKYLDDLCTSVRRSAVLQQGRVNSNTNVTALGVDI